MNFVNALIGHFAIFDSLIKFETIAYDRIWGLIMKIDVYFALFSVKWSELGLIVHREINRKKHIPNFIKSFLNWAK
jgi:hypothetical protein